MLDKFLFVANDVYFDVDQFVRDHAKHLYWSNYPQKLYPGAGVYMYLSGKTKAIKYELVVKRVKVLASELNLPKNYYDKYRTHPHALHYVLDDGDYVCELELKRELKDLAATSPANLKEHANIRGRLMNKRRLSPYSIEYLDALN